MIFQYVNEPEVQREADGIGVLGRVHDADDFGARRYIGCRLSSSLGGGRWLKGSRDDKIKEVI